MKYFFKKTVISIRSVTQTSIYYFEIDAIYSTVRSLISQKRIGTNLCEFVRTFSNIYEFESNSWKRILDIEFTKKIVTVNW